MANRYNRPDKPAANKRSGDEIRPAPIGQGSHAQPEDVQNATSQNDGEDLQRAHGHAADTCTESGESELHASSVNALGIFDSLDSDAFEAIGSPVAWEQWLDLLATGVRGSASRDRIRSLVSVATLLGLANSAITASRLIRREGRHDEADRLEGAAQILLRDTADDLETVSQMADILIFDAIAAERIATRLQPIDTGGGIH